MNMTSNASTTKRIRVIAPSQSWSSGKYQRSYERAKERLESLGYEVSYGKNVGKDFHLGTATKQERADDFNAAYADKDVDIVMALTGGWSANEILPLVDWDVVISNPKPLIGFSDITVLLNAVYAKTGQRGYLGPNFSTFGRMLEWKYTLATFHEVMSGKPTTLRKSTQWGTRGRKRYSTPPRKIIQTGEAEAVVIGGNLGTFYLLQGTEYQPVFDKPFIFALEDDAEAGGYTAKEVSRRFESVLQLHGFRQNIRGLLIGRFEPDSELSYSILESIILSKELSAIPIVAGIDFGHTLPIVTLPIGGMIKLTADKRVTIEVLQARV